MGKWEKEIRTANVKILLLGLQWATKTQFQRTTVRSIYSGPKDFFPCKRGGCTSHSVATIPVVCSYPWKVTPSHFWATFGGRLGTKWEGKKSYKESLRWEGCQNKVSLRSQGTVYSSCSWNQRSGDNLRWESTGGCWRSLTFMPTELFSEIASPDSSEELLNKVNWRDSLVFLT